MPQSYWHDVTHAEALLLMGRFEEAGRAYRASFEQAAHRAGDIRSTRQQAERILALLPDAPPPADVLGP